MIHVRMAREIKLGVKNLLLHKLRSLLAVLGVVFGTSSVIAMLAVGEGASREALDQINRLGSQNIIISAAKPAGEADSAPTQKQSVLSIFGLTYDDGARIAATIPGVTRVAVAKILRQNAVNGARGMEVRLVGTTEDWFALVRRKILSGRVLTADDCGSNAAVCVLADQAARQLFPGQDAIGKSLRAGSNAYTVVGIVEAASGGGGRQTPDMGIDAYVPLATLREHQGDGIYRRLSGSLQIERVELHQIIAEISDLNRVEPCAEAIKAMLTAFHKKKDYEVNVPLELLRQAEATKRTFNIVLGAMAGISLLVGGIGIMNIMLATVTERTREIGIRRAIGAKRKQIVTQFLTETVVLSGSGGVLGVALGVLLPWLVTRFSGMPTIVPAYAIILSAGISITVGIVFGLYPAALAAKLDPIEALRRE